MSVFKYEEESDDSPNPLEENTFSSFDLPKSTSYPEPRLNLLDGTFFQFLPEKSTSSRIVALCIKCMPREVLVRGFENCSSNFLSHLKRRHGEDSVEEYKRYIKCKRNNIKHSNNERRQSAAVFNDNSFVQSSKKQPNQFDENVLKFFISAMVPPSAVENPFFSKMFLNSNLHDIKIPTQQYLEQQIKQQYTREMANIKQKLSEQEYLCTTVNIWNGEKHNILTMTGHWITQEKLNRQSVALGCRLIKHRIVEANDISQFVQELNSNFELNSNQIVATITGRTGNYTQGFMAFGVQLTNVVLNSELELEDCITFDADDLNSNEQSEVHLRRNGNSSLGNNHLPASLNCCTDLLSKVLTEVIHEDLPFCNLSNLHMSTMNKCNALWERVGQMKYNEVITIQLGRNLQRPNYTNWNSLFNSLHAVLATKDKNFQLHKALDLSDPFTEIEFNYLQELLICTEPIAEALNILQGEKNSYYGIVMPCLFALRRNLLRIIEKTNFVYCQDLVNYFEQIINTIFTEFYDFSSTVSQNAAIAALSFPRFKNRWLVCLDSAQEEYYLQLFKTVLSKEMNVVSLLEPQSVGLGYTQKESSFFNFGGDSERENSKVNLQRSLNARFVKAEAQILQFFTEENTDLNILNNYPEIKKIFIKYNTPLPSLAFGENLFSISNIQELRMNPKVFNPLYEKRLILKANMNMDKVVGDEEV